MNQEEDPLPRNSEKYTLIFLETIVNKIPDNGFPYQRITLGQVVELEGFFDSDLGLLQTVKYVRNMEITRDPSAMYVLFTSAYKVQGTLNPKKFEEWYVKRKSEVKSSY